MEDKAQELNLIAQGVVDALVEDSDLNAIVIVWPRNVEDYEVLPAGMVSNAEEEETNAILAAHLPPPEEETEPAIWTPDQGIVH